MPPTERAQETGLAARTLGRAADAFDTHGIISLFRPSKEQREDHHRSLPVTMHQLIVDLKAVPESRRFETSYRSLQGQLWDLDESMGHLASRLPEYARRKKHRKKTMLIQLPLLEDPPADQE